MNDSEKELVRMVLSGNHDAFEPLVSPYRKSLLSLAFRMSQNREDAREICQETLLRVFKYLRRYDPSRSFKNWLLQILVNVAKNFKKGQVQPSLRTQLAPNTDRFNPEKDQQESEFRRELKEYLVKLTPREREIFLLRDIEECSIKETARILGCSSVSVRVHLVSARHKIREAVLEKKRAFQEKER